MPAAIVLAAGGIIKIKKKIIKLAIIVFSIITFLTVILYTYKHRMMPRGLGQVYSYLKDMSPPGSRVMCSRNALSLYSDRPSIWLSMAGLHELSYLFWDADQNEALAILSKYNIGYILIEKDRIYDDRTIKHTGGYPDTFVKKLATFGKFTKIIDNNDAQLWKIQN